MGKRVHLLRGAAGAWLALGVVGCSGVIGPGGPSPGPGSSSSAACQVPSPGPAPLRRLTRAQYNNTVRDLLGDTTRPAAAFPPDDESGEFANNATTLTVSPLLAEGYQQAAERLAQAALARKDLLPCDPATIGEEACAQAFIGSFGARAYRRPLGAGEAAALLALFRDNRQGADWNNGLQSVIEAVLQSAPFLYQVEAGDAAAAQPGGPLPLTSWEMASRLSYFLWNSMPDDALFAAAANDSLRTAEQIAAQAERMLADPRAHDASAEFFIQWLRLDVLTDVAKDAAAYPLFTAPLRASMRAETLAFVDWAVWGEGGGLAALLQAPVSFLDVNTAALYGRTDVTSRVPVKTDVDPAARAGLLTQPAVLAINAKPNQSSPVLRGKWVRERLLCQPMPPPPPNLNITPPAVTPGVSTRERFAQHDKDQACAGCHRLMDPVGFSFEHYDGIGAYRAADQGHPVDASGTLIGSDVDGDYVGAVALAAKLAASQEVKDCVATQWFRYAMGRGETLEDQCSVGQLKQAFAASHYDLRALLLAITRTPAFRYRPEVTP